MDKTKIIETIVAQLERDLARLKEAARATYEAATHEESKPENEYDTRGLEASYLAGAQSQRVAEIEELIFVYKQVKPRSFKDNQEIASTALVEVDLDGKHSWVFIMPKGGGFTVTFSGKPIQIVSPSSPLGEALIGLSPGDVATVETGNQAREYEIISVE
ncbi:MAG TPA: GreA/GreB family elongation factor [Bdellovibrionales bacterium]|nr:GreA/GreB family elongation factor [Bdellovibrionales bacterium]